MAEANRREYVAGNIAVSFDSTLCIHTGRCLRGLPEVFDLEARPWIRPANGTLDDIVGVVSRCPSGALQWRTLDDSVPDPVGAEPPSIRVTTNGPLFVRGTIDIVDAQGERLTESHRAALCRCGMSGTKPFCDNSHVRNGWRADGGTSG